MAFLVSKPETEMLCSICLEQYKFPKLLPCRHTFCAKCLNSYKTRNRDSDESVLVCPLCRSSLFLPQGGVSSFLQNFFVEVTDSKDEFGVCKNCFQSKNDITDCSHCELHLCEICMTKHCHDITKSRRLRGSRASLDFERTNIFSSDSDSSLSPDLSSDEESPELSTTSLSRLPLDPIRTVFVASLISNFHLRENIPGRIRKILPDSNDQCWVIATESLDLCLYNLCGKLLKRIRIGEYISGLCRSKGKLLLCLSRSRRIVSLNANDETTIFLPTGTFQPLDVAAFEDGRIVLVGVNDSVKNEGRIQIYSEDKELLADYRKRYMDPHSMSINQSCRSICISNVRSRSLDVFLDNGVEIAKYKGKTGRRHRRGMLFSYSDSDDDEEDLLPLGSCSDMTDFIVLVDGSTGLLHVLDFGGKFVGPVLPTDESSYGQSQCVSVDESGRIWTGGADGVVRAFNIDRYVNKLRNSSDDEY